MSLIGHWYECLLELIQLPFGHELGLGGIWRQPLEPYLAYGWLSVIMAALAFCINPFFQNPLRIFPKVMYFCLAGVVIMLYGHLDAYLPMANRYFPLPAILSTLFFGWIVFGLTLKCEHLLDAISPFSLATICSGMVIVVLFLQIVYGA